MHIEFTLNGHKVDIDVPADRRAVDLLRHDLGLTGTKEGCGSGECGVCTFMVNGTTRLSCLMLAVQLSGCIVETIEGVAGNEKMSAIQNSFVQHGAVQCGFCTPGMVVTAGDLLKRNPHPLRGEIREAISGNLCRCTGYQKIVDAIEAVAKTSETEAQK